MFWYFEMVNNEEEYHRRVPIKDVREEGTRYRGTSEGTNILCSILLIWTGDDNCI